MSSIVILASSAIFLHCVGTENSSLLPKERGVSFSLSEKGQVIKGNGGPFLGTIDQETRKRSDGTTLFLADYSDMPTAQLQLTVKADWSNVTWMLIDYRGKNGEGIVASQGQATCATKIDEKAD